MRLAQHVQELAAAFEVEIVELPDDPRAIAFSGAGYPVITCPRCGTGNRLLRTGTLRCGRCRLDFGEQRIVRCVRFAQVVGHFTYAVALHELGHCLAPMGIVPAHEFTHTFRRTGQFGNIRDIQLKLEEERAAWAWARHYALEWTAEMDAAERVGLSSYDDAARRILGRKP